MPDQPTKSTKSTTPTTKLAQPQPLTATLHQLTSTVRSKRKRLGRGIGSKTGKTAGRGHKGQRARSGHKIGFAFEGGQTPLYRRIPKRGFQNYNRTVYQPIALRKIVALQLTEVTPAVLHTKGWLKKPNQKYKVLGLTSVSQPIAIQTYACSRTARKAIIDAGGKVTIIQK